MSSAEKILERIAERCWVNQPSKFDQWNRFHGQTGWFIPASHNAENGVFHADPVTENRMVELDVNKLQISWGWPRR